MKPTVRVETLGSMWLIDEIDMVYMRLPKGEGPRKSPPGEDWTGPGAGVLQDYVWHPLVQWWIEDGPTFWEGKHADGTPIEISDQPVLRIVAEDGGLRAPCAYKLGETIDPPGSLDVLAGI